MLTISGRPCKPLGAVSLIAGSPGSESMVLNWRQSGFSDDKLEENSDRVDGENGKPLIWKNQVSGTAS